MTPRGFEAAEGFVSGPKSAQGHGQTCASSRRACCRVAARSCPRGTVPRMGPGRVRAMLRHQRVPGSPAGGGCSRGPPQEAFLGAGGEPGRDPEQGRCQQRGARTQTPAANDLGASPNPPFPRRKAPRLPPDPSPHPKIGFWCGDPPRPGAPTHHPPRLGRHVVAQLPAHRARRRRRPRRLHHLLPPTPGPSSPSVPVTPLPVPSRALKPLGGRRKGNEAGAG